MLANVLQVLPRILMALGLSAGAPAAAVAAAPAVSVAPAVPLAPAAQAAAATPAAAKQKSQKPGAPDTVSPEARPLVQKLQRFYENTQDFTADFHQSYRYKSFNRTMESDGTVAFKKPARMRWDYTEPREKSFIVDGKDLWIWTPEDRQAVRRRGFTSDQLSTSITFLWGQGRLADEFRIEKKGERRLLLTPLKPQGGFDHILFEVDPESGRVLASTVVDAQGNENRITFEDIRMNTGLKDARFDFTPPKGADVQELTEGGLK